MAELGASRGEDVDSLLTFVVVGAGPTGVEMAGQIAELAHRTLKRDFRAINTHQARVILLDAANQVLPPFGAKLGERTKRDLEKLGVEVLLGAMVTDLDERGIEVASRTAGPSGSSPSPRSGRPASRPARSARHWPRRAEPRSTARAGSASTPTSRCPGTPRCSSSAT